MIVLAAICAVTACTVAAAVALLLVPAAPVVAAPRCDRCGRPTHARRRVITHADDPLPSYWLACPTCAAVITLDEQERHARPAR